jgi:hypothetical protein
VALIGTLAPTYGVYTVGCWTEGRLGCYEMAKCAVEAGDADLLRAACIACLERRNAERDYWAGGAHAVCGARAAMRLAMFKLARRYVHQVPVGGTNVLWYLYATQQTQDIGLHRAFCSRLRSETASLDPAVAPLAPKTKSAHSRCHSSVR